MSSMTFAYDYFPATTKDVVSEEDSEARGLFKMSGTEDHSTLLLVAQCALQIF